MKKLLVTSLVISVLVIGCGSNESSSENKIDNVESVTEYYKNANESDVNSNDEAVEKYKTETDEARNTNDETEKQAAEDEEKTENELESSGVFGSYSNALIKAAKKPAEVWDEVPVKEIRSAIGIHFYIPVDWNLT